MNQNEEIENIEETDLDLSEADDFEVDEEEIEIDTDDKEKTDQEATRAIVITLTQTQYEVVVQAIQHIKDQFDYPIYDGKAVEIMAAEYLGGVKYESSETAG